MPCDEEQQGSASSDTTEPSRDYEPPRLDLLGTLEQLTQGIVPTSTDGVLPGSFL